MTFRATATLLGVAILVIAAPAAASSDVTPLRVITVSSISALQSAADAAAPGDRIELTDGTYTTSGSITLRRSGTAGAPITVAAQHLGRAEIRGSSGFAFANSDFVVVEGFRLTHSGGTTIPAGSEHVRFTRNLLQLGAMNWLTVTANDTEVDHNTFQNKSTEGVFLQVSGAGANDMAQRTWIHHNYFFNHSFTGANGGESIRVGLSFRQAASARSLIEFNLFERTNGDPETISVKSSDNTVRFNTIRNSTGSIVLRHGNRNLVEGNLMLGSTAGIRFYDNDHVVINNVIQGGTGQIIVGSGTVADDTTGSTAHARADRALVAFNTLVNNRTNLIDIGPGADQFGPNDCTFANNILVGGGSGGLVNINNGGNLHWQGNIVFAGTGGEMPASGFRSVNPLLVTDSGLNRLSSGSPAINTATGSFPQVTRDLDLQTRSGTKDVGADEFVAGGTNRRPLTTADVGPNAGVQPPPSGSVLEAESATIFHGVVESNHTGFTGSGFVNNTNEIGSFVEWAVSSPTAGSTTAVIRFANGTTVDRPMDITVNGVIVASGRSFPGNSNWDSWQTSTLTVTLTAGSNTIRATGSTANGGPNLDNLEVTNPA